MIWLYIKWQEFRNPKQPHPSMEFYDRIQTEEVVDDDNSKRKDVAPYLACFVVFALMAMLWVF